MIIVLDTNVIIGALLSPKGPPAEIIRRWEADELEVVLSPALLAELERALSYRRVRKYLEESQHVVATLIKRLETVATVVEPQISLDVITDDPADNRVLECALAGNTAYIVTGDARLLDLKEHQGVVILNPAGFQLLTGLLKKG